MIGSNVLSTVVRGLVLGCFASVSLCAQAESGATLRFDERWPEIAKWVEGQSSDSAAAVVVVSPDGAVSIRSTDGLSTNTPIPLLEETVTLRSEALAALREREDWDGAQVFADLFPDEDWSIDPIQALQEARVRFRPIYRGWISGLSDARPAEVVARSNLHGPRVWRTERGRSTEGGALVQWLAESGFERPWDEVLSDVVAPRLGMSAENLFARSPADGLRCVGWLQARVGDVLLDRAEVHAECAADDAAAVRLSSLHRLPVPAQSFSQWAKVPAGVTPEWRGGLRSPVSWFLLEGTTCIVVRARSGGAGDDSVGWRQDFEIAACKDLAGVDAKWGGAIGLGGGAGGVRGRFEPGLLQAPFGSRVELRRAQALIEIEVVDEMVANPFLVVRVDERTHALDLADVTRGRRNLAFSVPFEEGSELEFSLLAERGAWKGHVTEVDLGSGGRFPFAIALEPPRMPDPVLKDMIDAIPDGVLPEAGSEGPAQVFAAMVGDEVFVSVGGRVDARAGQVVTETTPIPLGGLTRLLALKAVQSLGTGSAFDRSLWLAGLEGVDGLRVRVTEDLFWKTEAYRRFLGPGESPRSAETIVATHLIPRCLDNLRGANVDGAFAVLQRNLERSGLISDGAHAWIRERLAEPELLSHADVGERWSAITSRGFEPLLRGEVELAHGLHVRPEVALRRLADAAALVARLSTREIQSLDVYAYPSKVAPGTTEVSFEDRTPRVQMRLHAIPELGVACLAFSNVAEPLIGERTAESDWVDRAVFEWRQGLREERRVFSGGRLRGGGGRGRTLSDPTQSWAFAGTITVLDEPQSLRFALREGGEFELTLGDASLDLEFSANGRTYRGFGTLTDGTEIRVHGRRSFFGSEMTLSLLLIGKDGERERFRLPAQAQLQAVRE